MNGRAGRGFGPPDKVPEIGTASEDYPSPSISRVKLTCLTTVLTQLRVVPSMSNDHWGLRIADYEYFVIFKSVITIHFCTFSFSINWCDENTKNCRFISVLIEQKVKKLKKVTGSRDLVLSS